MLDYSYELIVMERRVLNAVPTDDAEGIMVSV